MQEKLYDPEVEWDRFVGEVRDRFFTTATDPEEEQAIFEWTKPHFLKTCELLGDKITREEFPPAYLGALNRLHAEYQDRFHHAGGYLLVQLMGLKREQMRRGPDEDSESWKAGGS